MQWGQSFQRPSILHKHWAFVHCSHHGQFLGFFPLLKPCILISLLFRHRNPSNCGCGRKTLSTTRRHITKRKQQDEEQTSVLELIIDTDLRIWRMGSRGSRCSVGRQGQSMADPGRQELRMQLLPWSNACCLLLMGRVWTCRRVQWSWNPLSPLLDVLQEAQLHLERNKDPETF